MLGMLIAYDANGDVVGTLDFMVSMDDNGDVIGLVDFGAQEDAGGELSSIWKVESPGAPVRGSKFWPEWIGSRAFDFRVELVGPTGQKRIGALVHKTSGHRRERAAIEVATAARIAAANGAAADIRDIVGGPDRPLALDADGRTIPPAPHVPPSLPIIPARKSGVTT